MNNRKNPKKKDIQFSFSKHNNHQLLQDKRLNVQILRVHAIGKQRIMNQIWDMDQQDLCNYFLEYQLFPTNTFTMDQLLNSNNLKLIKQDGKIYFGQMERKKRNGRGICIFKEGKIYEGQFIENQKTGYGVEIYSNGNLYMGEFLNNKKHGKGQFYWFNFNTKVKEQVQNAEYYEGEWWGGLPDGNGVHQKNNGDFYKGTFKNGLKHGMGSESFGNGDHYKGQYVNGMPEGFGQYEWSDGSFYKGDFKQGLRSGYGIWSTKLGEYMQSYQGHYSMDKKSGYGVYQWQNGWVYKGNFQNDYRNGYGELFDGETCVYRGYWINGEQIQSDDPRGARSASSMQMSKVSGAKISDKNFYETTDTRKQFNSEKNTYPNQFTIRKRPGSFSNLMRNSSTKNINYIRRGDNPEYQTGKTAKSTQKNIFKINNLFIPGIKMPRMQ